MNNKSVMYSVLAFSLVIAVVLGVLLSVSLASASVGVEENAFMLDKTFSFKVVYLMFIGCIAAFLVFTFVFKKGFSKKIKFNSVPYRLTSAVGAFLSGGLAVYGFFTLIKALNNADRGNLLLQSVTSKSGAVFPNVLFILLLLGTSVYFALCLAIKTEKRGNTFTAVSLLLPATLAIKLVFDFFVQNTGGYSKLYNYHLIALAFLLLFAVNESRVYLRKAAPALYVFFGVAGSMASILYAIPSLVLNAIGVLQLGSTTAVLYCAIDILMAMFVYIRLFSLGVKETNNVAIPKEPAVIFYENGDI